ncbi:MAG TPA: D-2-hydroxyacid dehydrogenase [Acidimicrobiales bacterium]|nr:D-2-hydroxyacid dehydrogenase [Acidimicrobiales bacterium]
MPEPLVHLHVKNNRKGQSVFRITPERWAAAEARHPDVASRTDVTIDFDLDHFDESMARAVGLVTWNLPTDGLAARAPNLRWIHIIGAGVGHLAPFDWLPPGVTLTNNSGVHAAKAGEYGLMAVLMLNNAVPRLVTAQREHRWVECFTSAIEGKTLLVIGAGQMGRAVARRARSVGLRTMGIRRRDGDLDEFEAVHRVDRLDDLLPEADFVLMTLPDVPDTRGLMDARRLGLMKPGAGLVNMGRGRSLDHSALAEALGSGHLSGAVLDVFEREPVPADSPLWDTPNLVMTPHMSSDDVDRYVDLTLDLVFDNLGRLMEGRELKNVVDPERGY